MAKNKNRKQTSRPERGADEQEKPSGGSRSEMAPVSPADVARKQRRFGHN